MTDGPDLLGRILAEPGEDLHRLQYADWLDGEAGTVPCGACGGRGGKVNPYCDENSWDGCAACRGSGRVPDGRAARAEFIRVQCELAGYKCSGTTHSCWRVESGDDCFYRCEVLRRRERALLEWGGYGWCDGLLGPDWKTDGVGKACPDVTVSYRRGAEHTGHMRLSFRRGFVEALTLSGADWLAHAAAVLAGHPVTRVTLTTWPEHSYRDRGDGRLVLREAERPGDWTARVREALTARWPGITFDLSSAVQAPHVPAANPGT